jgi:hypothetical protein
VAAKASRATSHSSVAPMIFSPLLKPVCLANPKHL